MTGSGREARRKRRAALVTSAFLAIGPGVVAGVIPWRLTHWQVPYPAPGGPGARAVGLVLIGGGAAVLVHSFVRFVVEGVGTPVPVAPTQRLVVGGLYRHVRNPMYLALEAAILGQALLLGAVAGSGGRGPGFG
ncbi:MAG: hypothetical protein H0V03_01915 [Thermoleophilaceae bacterium]|nr:hypothetical protein [Thermoleophilaceae bacterium]